VLISKNLILTAAHNIYNKEYKCENSDFKFYIGAHGITDVFYEAEKWRLNKSGEKRFLRQFGFPIKNRLFFINQNMFKIRLRKDSIINHVQGYNGSSVFFEDNVLALHNGG
jgi:hypothetical protein